MTSKPNEWWLTAGQIEWLAAVQAACAAIPAGESLSTNDLVQRLFPAETARGAGIDRRRALYSFLLSKAKSDLRAYCTRGPAKTTRYGMARPYLWHAPKKICPLCEGTGLTS